MSRFFNENLFLKLISLAAAIVMWLYVSAEQSPTIVPKTVYAEVKAVGDRPQDVQVRFREATVKVTIQGPKSEVDQIGDGQIKAEFPLNLARVGMLQLRGRPFQLPPNVTAVPADPVVGVEVLAREIKTMPITLRNPANGPAQSLGSQHIAPDAALARGTRDDLQRVAALVVEVEPNGQKLSADVPIKPVDSDGIEVAGVEVEPASAHVEITPAEQPQSRTLIVNALLRGQVAYPYQVSDVIVEPPVVVALGKIDALRQLSNISTQEVEITGLMADLTRDVRLQLPPGVTLE